MISGRKVYYKGKDRPASSKSDGRLTEECFRSAYRLLRYRQRSESELKTKLSARFDKVTVDIVIGRLRNVHMIDDVTFARHWREQRETLNPRSRRMVCLELRQKGVDKEVINGALCSYNDEENAYRAAKKKARLLSGEEHGDFRRKITAFLVRRGFTYEVTRQTVDRLWREQA